MRSEHQKEPSANSKDIVDQWWHCPSILWFLLGLSWQTNWSVQFASLGISAYYPYMYMYNYNYVVNRWWVKLASTSQFSWHLYTTSLHGFSLPFSRHSQFFLCPLHLKQLHSLLYLHLVLLWPLPLALQTPASSITGSCTCFSIFMIKKRFGICFSLTIQLLQCWFLPNG